MKWPRRKRWWVIAVLLLIGTGIAWKIFVRPEVEFIGFRETNGKRVAAFRINEPLFAKRHYAPPLLIRVGNSQVRRFPDWSRTDAATGFFIPTKGRELTFTIDAPVSTAAALNFEVGVGYIEAVPLILRKVPVQWLPKSMTSGKMGVVWSDMIAP